MPRTGSFLGLSGHKARITAEAPKQGAEVLLF